MKNLFLTLVFLLTVNIGFANDSNENNFETSPFQTLKFNSIDSTYDLNSRHIGNIFMLDLLCSVEVEVKVGFPPFWGAKVTVKDIPCDKVGETIQQVRKSLKKK